MALASGFVQRVIACCPSHQRLVAVRRLCNPPRQRIPPMLHASASQQEVAESAADCALRVAGLYMDLSSSHQLEKVFPLFSEDATYTSESLRGTWSGLQDIQAMMQPFFTKFPDVHWEVVTMFIVDRERVGANPSPSSGSPSSPSPTAAQGADPAAEDGVLHVEVHFIRRWTEEGSKQEAKGREWISVDTRQKLIVHVQVAKLGSMWDFW